MLQGRTILDSSKREVKILFVIDIPPYFKGLGVLFLSIFYVFH